MLRNYHHEFGSCLLWEHSLICKKCIKYEPVTFSLEVMWQHIFGVVGNVTQCFAGNLANFSAVKKLWKLVKIWRNYRHKRVTHFFETQCGITLYTRQYSMTLVNYSDIELTYHNWITMFLLFSVLPFSLSFCTPLWCICSWLLQHAVNKCMDEWLDWFTEI